MGVVAKEIGIKFCKFLIADALAYFVWKGVKNKINGKTILGKEIGQKENTYVDWKGNVILGTEDGQVT